MKSKKNKVYKHKNINALSRYLGISSQTLHWYKKEKPKKFKLLMLGWNEVCNAENDTE